MKTVVVTTIFLILPMGASLSLLADDSSTSLRVAFKMHCTKCHGEGGDSEGEVNLLALSSEADLRARPELLEDLLAVLKDRQMPPEDEPSVPKAKREWMITQVQSILYQALKTKAFRPIPIRRMNRFQYNNAVVDLLELDRDIFQLNERLLRRRDDYFRPDTKKMPAEVRVSSRPLSKDIDNQRPEGFRGVAAFPQDKRAEHGFDNRADHLTLSPLLMESFLQLSRTVVESPDLNAKECRSWNRFFAPPDAVADSDAIRNRIEQLLRRAFRRPVDPETLDRFTTFAETQIAAGESFERTMRTIVGAVLGMPDFLYFYESHDEETSGDSDDGRQPVSDFELATRLAQFLWSSIPDDTLLDLAASGSLSRPGTLSVQIDRMMNDRRSGRFCDNFGTVDYVDTRPKFISVLLLQRVPDQHAHDGRATAVVRDYFCRGSFDHRVVGSEVHMAERHAAGELRGSLQRREGRSGASVPSRGFGRHSSRWCHYECCRHDHDIHAHANTTNYSRGMGQCSDI